MSNISLTISVDFPWQAQNLLSFYELMEVGPYEHDLAAEEATVLLFNVPVIIDTIMDGFICMRREIEESEIELHDRARAFLSFIDNWKAWSPSPTPPPANDAA